MIINGGLFGTIEIGGFTPVGDVGDVGDVCLNGRGCGGGPG